MKMKQLIVSLILAATLSAPALAQEASPAIAVTSVWARATPPGAKTGVIYMTLMDKAKTADRLIDVSTPVADRAQLHVESNDNGVMRMRPLMAVDLAPGAQVVLKPGGMHVMLIGLKQPLKPGDSFRLTLHFEHAGTIETPVTVAKAGAMGMDHMGGMDHMNGMGHDMDGMSHGAMPAKP